MHREASRKLKCAGLLVGLEGAGYLLGLGGVSQLLLVVNVLVYLLDQVLFEPALLAVGVVADLDQLFLLHLDSQLLLVDSLHLVLELLLLDLLPQHLSLLVLLLLLVQLCFCFSFSFSFLFLSSSSFLCCNLNCKFSAFSMSIDLKL